LTKPFTKVAVLGERFSTGCYKHYIQKYHAKNLYQGGSEAQLPCNSARHVVHDTEGMYDQALLSRVQQEVVSILHNDLNDKATNAYNKKNSARKDPHHELSQCDMELLLDIVTESVK